MLRTKQKATQNNIHAQSKSKDKVKLGIAVNGLIQVKLSERKLIEISTLKLK